MAANKLIQKLNQALKKGDQKEIAEKAGLSKMTINRFLNGEDWCVSAETASKIIDAAGEIIKDRKKLVSDNLKKLNRINKKD